MYYSVVLKGNTNLAMAIDLNNTGGGLILSDLDNSSPAQQWSLVEMIASKDYGFAMINAQSGLAAYAPTYDGQVQQTSVANITLASAWHFEPAGGSPYGAIQLQSNQKLNLNADGKGGWGPDTQVLAYTWSGGKPNEVWELLPIDFGFNPSTGQA